MIIVDSEKQLAGSELINKVQSYIDEQCPIGADVTVTTATTVSINVCLLYTSLQSQGVLYDGADCRAYIDVQSQREWLAQKYDVSDWTDSEVEVANTGSIIFAGADITIQDCIEDLSFKIGLE